ncbi:thioredoxin H9-like [Cynara cardunculus var. scolymus]|uniref:Thioredoxin n=1 Tax=Cynara cardunculus var. scolymus TaxID=59895 RepID=A0A103YDH9_CYNCS|nr:thioredoxin H9-like [Cynara cardunculus var. scolymus]KVI07087.1 Thioredoxin [Cynara cardunculus var. scolymus]
MRPGSKQYLASELGGGKVTLITTTEKWDEKLTEAKNKGQLVVVNFSAAWSTPCRFIATAYRNLADKHDSLMFLTVDVDQLPEFSTSWNIKATPTFFFLINGQPIDSFVGADEKELAKKIEAAAAGFIQVQ